MPRIVYICINTQKPTGGHKMIIRHVEALNDMGFEAVIHTGGANPTPDWLSHSAEFRRNEPLRHDDWLVIPDDATPALRHFAPFPNRKIVFLQNHFLAAENGIGVLTEQEAAPYADFMACSRTVAAWIATYFPGVAVAVVPAFADERLFRPHAAKDRLVVSTPRKREFEVRVIRHAFFARYRPATPFEWGTLVSATEQQVARTFGRAAIFLSLSRFEGLGMTTLEAMACGCLVAGFTGIGGREYATSANGFWVGEDDCDAAAAALAEAAALVDRNDPRVAQMTEAARETAAHWSHQAFLKALEAFWSARVARG